MLGREGTAQPRSPEAKPRHTSDHLANERTFLAWVRTAIALIGLGFVVARFMLYLKSLAAGGAASPVTLSRSAVLGVALVGMGAVTVLLGFLHYLATSRAIEREAYRSSPWLNLVLAVVVGLVAIVLMAFLLTSTSG
jgi:putative membrane protein